MSRDFGAKPLWAPDGRQLYYGGRAELMVVEVDTEPTFRPGTPQPLFDTSAYRMSGARKYDVAPEGNRFVFLKVGTRGQTSDAFRGMVLVQNWTQELLERVPVP